MKPSLSFQMETLTTMEKVTVHSFHVIPTLLSLKSTNLLYVSLNKVFEGLLNAYC